MKKPPEGRRKGELMSTNIICDIQPISGLWRVVARTPGGHLLVISRPDREDAVREALLAEPEPA